MENETKKEESADQLVLMKMANLNDVNQNLKDVIGELKKVDHFGNAAAIVESLGKLSKELQLKLSDVEKAAKKELPAIPQPNISVKAPQVTVDAPDLAGIEALLKTRLPEIVKQMTDAIPEVPETDLGKVEELLNKLLLTTAEVRDRKFPVPQMPTTLKVTNPDGSLVGASDIVLATGSNTIGSVELTDGTNIANVLANDTGYNGLAVNNGTKVLPFTSSGTGAQVLLDNTDVRGYSSITLVWTGVGSGLAATVQFAPNSGGTYGSPNSFQNHVAGQTSTPSTSGVTNGGIYFSPVIAAFMHLNITALASGTASGYIILSNQPAHPYTAINVAPANATGSAVPAGAYYIGMLNNNAGTLVGLNSLNVADGATGNTILSSGAFLYNGTNFDKSRSGGVTGMAGVSLQASPSGGYSFLHIAAGQATTTVKSGAGTLHAIVFNGAATATNTTTIYDNTAASGTVIGIPAATAVTTPETVIYDLAFATGLTIITATANGADMTVVYK